MFEAERAAMLFFQNIRIPVVNEIMKFFSAIGDTGLVWFVIIAALLVFKKTRRIGFDILLSLAVCWCVSNLVIKPIISRVRPYVQIPELTVLIKYPPDTSFPSGHACSSFTCAIVGDRSFRDKRIRAGFWLLASLITISRIYVGVHYPTDLLAGALIGVLGGLAVYKLNKRFIPAGFLAK